MVNEEEKTFQINNIATVMMMMMMIMTQPQHHRVSSRPHLYIRSKRSDVQISCLLSPPLPESGLCLLFSHLLCFVFKSSSSALTRFNRDFFVLLLWFFTSSPHHDWEEWKDGSKIQVPTGRHIQIINVVAIIKIMSTPTIVIMIMRIIDIFIAVINI